MLEIFKYWFLNNPENLALPFFEDYPFIEYLSKCPFPDVISVYSKVVRCIRVKIFTFHKIFEALN